jgi:hypothetical protein
MNRKVIQFPVRAIDPSWRRYRFALMRAEHHRRQRSRIAVWVAVYAVGAAIGALSAYAGYWLGGRL